MAFFLDKRRKVLGTNVMQWGVKWGGVDPVLKRLWVFSEILIIIINTLIHDF